MGNAPSGLPITRMLITTALVAFGTFLTGYSWVEGQMLGVLIGLALLVGGAVTISTPSRR